MNKKKILIISQTIFPAQFPRSYRATELAIELSRQGHEVILYATLGEYDYTSFQRKYNLKVKNIAKMWFAKTNSVNYGNRNFLDKVLTRIFKRYIEFPDIELMFRMSQIFQVEENIDLLISIAMPHPIHWGCAMAKQKNPNYFPRIWIADCGDPYMGNKFLKKRPIFYFKYLEKWFCRTADYISIPIEGARNAYYSEFHRKIKIIPQGFRFETHEINYITQKNSVPTFAYSGIFYKDLRDPTLFLEYLRNVLKSFKFIIYTPDQTLLEPYLKDLKDRIEVRKYIPRDLLIKELSKMDFLVNIENETSVQSPSKLIDYAIANRPILSISSKQIPEKIINEFLNGNYINQFKIQDIDQYRIENVAKKFLDLVDDVN